ncbi:MAG: GAF domain-containing sensor histidine kinase [Acidobacteria bacterium]|nr:GAF domain-containing sensor histidine kinase [Acidobacteriota bacterium]
MLEATSAWGRAASFGALLEDLGRIRSVLDFECCAILLEPAADLRARVVLIDGACARAVDTKRLLPAPAAAILERAMRERRPVEDDTESRTLAYPLESGARLIGALCFLGGPQPYEERDLRFAQFIAETLGGILDRLLTRERLAASEEKYRKLFESIDEGVALCELVRDADGNAIDYRILEHNAAFAKHGGLTARDGWIEPFVRAVESGQPLHLEEPTPHSQRWYAISLYPRGADRFAVIDLDITQQKRAESELRSRETWLTAQKEAFQAAINGDPLNISLGVLVATAVEQAGGDLRCAFYLADTTHTGLQHVAGMPESYARCVDGFRIGPDSLACGLAAYSDRPIITPDVRTDPRWKDWLWLAEEGDYRACWSFPLQALSGKVIGTLAMYFRTPRHPSPSDYELIGVMTRAAAIIIARMQDEEELRESRLRLARELEDAKSLQRVSSFLIKEENADGLYEAILDAVIAMTQADVGTIEILDEESEQLHLVASRNPQPESTAFASERSTPLETRDGRLVGSIALRWRDAHTPEEREMRLIDVLARQAADVFERRRALESLRDREERLRRLNDELEARVRERTTEIDALFSRLVSAQEEERQRIARDIHDQLGQQMTALRLHLEALRAKADGNGDLLEQVERTKRLAEELDQSIEALTWELRPAALDHLGLPAALAHLVSGWSERFGIETDYETFGIDGTRFAPEVEANLYRLTQEALHNVCKHAHAARVSVVLEKRDHRLVLVVDDDGVGFAQSADDDAKGSFGLLNMRERALLAGGELTIESTPGHGTTLIVRVPLANTAVDRPAAPA